MSEQHTTVMNGLPTGAPPAEQPEPAAAADKPAKPAKPAKGRTLRLGLAKPGSGFSPSGGVWAGLGLTVLGFVLIFFSWIKVAALLDVGRQMPYVVSGAMTGLGLIVVGVAIVDMAVRRQDRIERRQQITLMRTVLEEIREVVDRPAERP